MYINNVKDFKELCDFIVKNVNVIGIDTEFIRHYTYYPKLSLIQIVFEYKNKKNIYIVDILLINDISPFKKILKSKKIKKIFFSFSQDLDAFLYHTKYINNIEDIQLILEFSGCNENMSYANAVKKILNINFRKNKALQNGDWEKRPLTDQQIIYASKDVIYLLDMYKEVVKHIGIKNYKYYKNEIKYILKFKDKKYLADNAWKKSKFLLHKKTVEYVLLFREIAKWRELEAIKNNSIRSFIIEDEDIDLLIKNKIRNSKDLKALYSYRNILNLKKEYKIDIVNIINNFYSKYDSSFGNTIFYMIEKGFIYKNKMLEIYKKVQEISEENNIFIERSLSKTDIIFLIMNYEKKRSIIYGWKYCLFSNIFYN